LQPYLPYHASSIIASVLETILLPLQEKGSSSLYMRELTDNLVEYGRKAVAVSCAVPLQNMACMINITRFINKLNYFT
jgi:hypothetical protein